MIQTKTAKFCILTAGILSLPVMGIAGTTVHSSGKDKTIIEKAHESCITGDIGLDIVSEYIARGIPLENQGAILQPYIDLYFKIYEGDGILNKVSVDLSFWNSFQSRHTGAIPGSSTAAWFESDFQAGLSFTLAKNFILSPYYRAYLSPNDAFNQAHDLGVRLAYDDHDLWGGGFSLHPYGLVQWDIDGTSGNGGDQGVYFEVGISPGVQVGPVALSLPIRAGFGTSNYYANDEGFGYFSVGARAEYHLAFVPSCLGDWSIHGEADYYRLGDGTKGANVPAIRDTDENEWVFRGGLKVAF
jgi:hypothetical protein